MSLTRDLVQAMKCKCPVCGQGRLFDKNLNIVSSCAQCSAALGDHDVGDGAVFIVLSILATLITPLAWWVDIWLAPPLWAHAIVWSVLSVVLTIFLLAPVKSYFLIQEFRHRS